MKLASAKNEGAKRGLDGKRNEGSDMSDGGEKKV